MRLLVVGLAGTGAAVVDDAVARGDAVVVTEDRPTGDGYLARAAHARDLGVDVVEAPDDARVRALVAGVDLVIPSPGVAPSHPAIVAATAANVPVRSEIDLAVERLRVPTTDAPAPAIVAITGTNGKTTVTSMIAAMGEASGLRSPAVGNIGSPLIALPASEVDVAVVEVSTFQLEFTTAAFAPDVAVLLNVAQDHVDWHGSVEAYVAAKAKVFAGQLPSQVLVVNVDDPVSRELATRAPGRVVTCSRTAAEATFHVETGDEGDGVIVGPAGVRVQLPAFRAAHDVDNAIAATAAALQVGATVAAIEATLASWTNLPHRVALVATVDGVDFVDDSKATNAHATASVLDGMDHVVLIAGGRDRSRNLHVLRPYASHLRAVVAIGEAASTVETVFADVVPVARADSMRGAVREAAARSQRGDTVLLSPACASLDWYSSYAERGDDFAREVATLEREA
ncbi:MAG: UDP-N-acetylmuramoyl-L-alanine--D-glutamate ligase [Acidimicrobiia bacterium]